MTNIATAAEIRSILGPVSDELIMSIRALGANKEDIRKAAHWLETGEHNLDEMHSFAHEIVARVHDVLMEDRNRFLADD